jgi:hypothetical protein
VVFRRDEPRPKGRSDKADTLALFSVVWALAACWHVVGNVSLGPSWAQAPVVVAVAAVLIRPGAVPALAALAVTSLVLLWEEAPILGNHWLLVGLVDLAVLFAFAMSAVRRRFTDRIDMAERLFPAARLCLLCFYFFAAFAKLNSAFFDRSVSCAAFFFRESTESIGVDGIRFGGAAWPEQVVIVATIATELSIPILLLRRRTRPIGVLLGLAFHFLVAVDQTHQFYDFSSVLFALFVLFLPQTAGAWVGERMGSIRARLALRGPRLPEVVKAAVVAVVLTLSLLVVTGAVSARDGVLMGWWPWQAFGLAAVVASVRYVRQRPPAYGPAWRIWPHHPAYLFIPILVVANGLSPYLELKTATGWNMYSNLRTVDGESNHLLVGRSFPVIGEQDDLVEIVRSDAPELQYYADSNYGLPFLQLREFLARHPQTALTYDRSGERITLRRADDRPELVAPVPTWREKLQVYRAVDLQSPERCQPGFGPAH